MTARERRLLRLVQLRERQHEVAVLPLRAARSELAAAEAALTDAQERIRAAQLCGRAAAADNDPTEWLLAQANFEMSSRTAASNQGALVRARTKLQQAAEAEATARLEREQMEAILHVVQRQCAENRNREEQRSIDEIARLQRGRSAASPPWRRGL